MEAGFARLSLMVVRLLDAEVLLEDEGAALLAEAAIARRSLEDGDDDGARRHMEQLMRFTEALVRSAALDDVHGRAIVETARRLVGDSQRMAK